MSQNFTLLGPPRTKKNSGIISTRGRPRILPSAAFTAWNRIAQMQLARIRADALGPLPFTVPVNVKAHFYREKNIGDAVGYYQALADALEEGGIVENDRLIERWDGSRLMKDSERPRVEVWIEEIYA